MRNSPAQVGKVCVAPPLAQAGGLLVAELQVWLGQSGTVFGVNFSMFKILALMDAMLKTGNHTAIMAARLDLAPFFLHYLGCSKIEITFTFQGK